MRILVTGPTPGMSHQAPSDVRAPGRRGWGSIQCLSFRAHSGRGALRVSIYTTGILSALRRTSSLRISRSLSYFAMERGYLAFE